MQLILQINDFFKKKQKPVTLGLYIFFHPVMDFDINKKTPE